jgi:excinuclease ABC subunit C
MKKKLNKAIPEASGIYLFKDKDNQVIYIGKAKSLIKRVSSYFQKQTSDWKVQALVQEQEDIDYILTKNETEALLLEAQLIRDHKPKYNVLLTSGNPFLYIVFTKDELVKVEIVRNKEEVKGTYFGPFLQKMQARKAYGYLIRTFRLFLCNKKIDNGCLDYHLEKCAGSCKKDFDASDYNFRVSLALDALKRTPQEFIKKIKEKIKEYNSKFEFEKAKHLSEYLPNVDIIFHSLRTRFTETKFEHEIFAATTPTTRLTQPYDEIALELKELLHLKNDPIRIDCFDISHFQSSYLVGSCVRFAFGKPDKNNFRKFNIKTLTEQNDYAALQEIVSRRYRDPLEIPDLIVIDGGKGQLNAARAMLPPTVEIVSLAKREEIVYSEKLPEGVKLDVKKPSGKLLIELRDYAHHFAISHHRNKRMKNATPVLKRRLREKK